MRYLIALVCFVAGGVMLYEGYHPDPHLTGWVVGGWIGIVVGVLFLLGPALAKLDLDDALDIFDW